MRRHMRLGGIALGVVLAVFAVAALLRGSGSEPASPGGANATAEGPTVVETPGLAGRGEPDVRGAETEAETTAKSQEALEPWDAEVVLLDRRGQPVVGARLEFIAKETHTSSGSPLRTNLGSYVTDARGRVSLTAIGQRHVTCISAEQPAWFEAQPLASGRNEIKSTRGLPLIIEGVDLATGAAIPGVRWCLHDRFHPTPNPEPSFPHESGAAFPLAPGEQEVVHFGVVPPRGYARPAPAPLHIRIHRRAESLVFHAPLCPAGALLLDIMTEEGAPRPERLSVYGGLVGSHPVLLSATPAAGGTWRVAGVPSLSGGDLLLRVRSPGFQITELRVAVGTDGLPSNAITCALHQHVEEEEEEIEEPFEPSIGLGGARVRREPRAGKETGTLDLQLRYDDGRPFADRVVTVRARSQHFEARTDAVGRLKLERIESGTVHLTFGDWIVTRQAVDLAPGETSREVLTEAQGATLRISVRNRDGAPIPWARCRLWQSGAERAITSPPTGGVQRIDPYVGADGARTLTGLPAKRTRLVAVTRGAGQSPFLAPFSLVEGEATEMEVTFPGLPRRPR